MATLVLLRHAKAEPHGSGGADFDRPLSLRGRHQAGGLGGLLTAHDAVPQVVLCSAAVRAAQTWQLAAVGLPEGIEVDRKSTRLNSSHVAISYAVFCLKKKKNHPTIT